MEISILLKNWIFFLKHKKVGNQIKAQSGRDVFPDQKYSHAQPYRLPLYKTN